MGEQQEEAKGIPSRVDGDTDLARRAVAGDGAAFEEIVTRYTPLLWRVARSRLRDTSAAEDVVQETFLKAYRNLYSYRREASLSVWLRRICLNLCTDRMTRSLRRENLVTMQAFHEGLHSHMWQEDRGLQRDVELRNRLQQEVNALTKEEREAFILVEVWGYSRQQAAGILGVPPSTMRSRVSRARTQLAMGLRRDLAEG
jgi:RNA polymerase sigma-70 factor (ECF subfamily)